MKNLFKKYQTFLWVLLLGLLLVAGTTQMDNIVLKGTSSTAANQVFGANNLLTGTLGDARYGELGAGNTWSGANVFNGALSGTHAQSVGTGDSITVAGLTVNGSMSLQGGGLLAVTGAASFTGSVLASQYTGSEATLGTSGTLTVDWSKSQSTIAQSGNVTLQFSNFATNTLQHLLGLRDDASHTWTWPSTEANGVIHWTWGTTTAPTNTSGKFNIYQLSRMGGTNYGGIFGGGGGPGFN